MTTNHVRRAAFISSCTLRKYGIATFTSDLIANIKLASEGEFESIVVAMESGDEIDHGESVKLKIRRDVKYDYIRAADYINFSDGDVVFVQHEFGLFGDENGSYLSLLKDKGIEVMLRALPTIVKADPSILYIVLGMTHPEVLRCEGQSYKKIELERMVGDLGLRGNVVFYNRFLDDKELFQFLGAADVHVTHICIKSN